MIGDAENVRVYVDGQEVTTLFDAVHFGTMPEAERQAEFDAEQHARDVLDATYRRRWQALLDQIYGLPYEPPRFAEVERVAAKYADGGRAGRRQA